MKSEEQLKSELQSGKMIESVDEMTEGYKEALENILLVSGDTELMSAPAYYEQTMNAPTMDARASCVSVIQDELGHAHIAYRLLVDLDESYTIENLLKERDPKEFRNTYGFDQHIETFPELVTAHGLFDQAGMVLLGDIEENTSYAPWKRALRKVEKEEQFHLRHGRTWIRRLSNQQSTKEDLQKAIDWMFPMGVEWFGLPDDQKTNTEQLDYRIKGKTNDELRQEWLSEVVPFLKEQDLDIPAHYDEEADEYVLEYDLPVAFNEEDKEWQFDEPISWKEMLNRWRNRGPANEKYVNLLQEDIL